MTSTMQPVRQTVRKQLPGLVRRQRLKKIMPSFAPTSSATSGSSVKGRQGNVPPTINWNKIFEHFHPKLFVQSIDRHKAIFERLCLIHGSGLPLHDLANVADFLMVVKTRMTELVGGRDRERNSPADRSDQKNEVLERLRAPLCKYLAVLRRPFASLTGHKTVAELTNDLKFFTRVVGDLIDMEDEHITASAVQVLFKLSGGPKIESPICTQRIVTYPWLLDAVSASPSPAESTSLPQYDPHNTEMELLRILNDSHVIQNLTRALRQCCVKSAHSLSYHNDILRALRRLSASELCIAQMIADDTFRFLIEALPLSGNPSDWSITIEIFWNALESPHKRQVAEALSSEKAIETLSNQLTDAHSPDFLTDLIIVCTEISRLHPNNTVWTDKKILDNIWALLNRVHPAGTTANADTTDLFVLQKELFAFLLGFCKRGGEILEWYLRKGLLELLLAYLTFTPQEPSIMCWSVRQLKGLQLQVLTVLQEVLPYTPFELHTHPTLHPTLQLFLQQALEHDAPSSPPGDAEHPNPSSDFVGLVPSVLRTIVKVCEREVASCLLIGETDGFAILIGILKTHPPLPSPTSLTALTLLTTLLGPMPNRRKFAATPDSISTLLAHLDTQPLAALSAIWATLPPSSDAILIDNGVQRVLDVLVLRRDWETLSVGLGLLCDLVENHGVAKVMKEWRDKTETGVVRWLISLWKGVEVDLGVPQGPHGMISLEGDDSHGPCRNPLTCDVIIKPLAHQRHIIDVQDDFTEDIEEMGWNLRAKIYSLIQHLMPLDVSVLSPEEEIKLIMIHSYPTFKHHVLLRTLSHSLYKANIRPTEPDQEVLDMAEVVLREKKRYVHDLQTKVIERHIEKEKEEDESFWKEVQWAVSLKEVKPKKSVKSPAGARRQKNSWRDCRPLAAQAQ
ncbi:hypothetical protein HDU86_002123 [Geranomyces michiganensis]|nr:hypothetical protein HDU86_002123 [Geranomyces michiganensis]